MWTKLTLSTVMQRDAHCETQGISKLLHGTSLQSNLMPSIMWSICLSSSIHTYLSTACWRLTEKGVTFSRLKEEGLSIITDPGCKGEAFTERAIPISYTDIEALCFDIEDASILILAGPAIAAGLQQLQAAVQLRCYSVLIAVTMGDYHIFPNFFPNSLEISKAFGKVWKSWKKVWKNFSKDLPFGTTIFMPL
jgi:hypothetical protein